MSEHKCSRFLKNRQATSTWIANQYVNKFRRNPNWKVIDLEKDLLEKYCVEVTKWKCYRAKSKALEMLRGSIHDHYGQLRSFKAELMRIDKDGRFDFLLKEYSTFSAFYMGFSSLRRGFLKGCRPIIGFDG